MEASRFQLPVERIKRSQRGSTGLDDASGRSHDRRRCSHGGGGRDEQFNAHQDRGKPWE